MAEKETQTFDINKNKNFNDWFNDIVEKAELADLRYNVKGFVVFRPWAVRTINIMYELYEKELQKRKHEPVIFPAVIPESNFKLEAEHVKGFSPEVFWVTEHGDNEKLEEKLALRPTSETAMYKMYSLWIRSWRDLPLKLYQRAQVCRYETKATKAFLRGREFYWIETHNCFATLKEAENQVLEDMEISEKIIHKTFGVPFIFFRRPEWDKFAGAVYTFACDAYMPSGRMVQLPSTHLLGQNFSKPFEVKFKDENEKEQYVYQTCYGPSISRIFASVFSVHGDDKGLVLPFVLAPVQIIIIPILKTGAEKKITEKCMAIKKKLEPYFRTEIDDSDKKPGNKFYFWEMKGVPLRLEIGLNEITSKELVLFRRDTGKKIKVKESELKKKIAEQGAELTKNLFEKADREFKNTLASAKNFNELKEKLESGKIVKINFCSREKDGIDCAKLIKEKLGAEVRGDRADEKEKPDGNCVICSKKANSVVYIARQY